MLCPPLARRFLGPLALLALAPAQAAAQRARSAPLPVPRLVALNHPPQDLAVDAAGVVHLACVNALVRLDRTGALEVVPLFSATAFAISQDASVLAGLWPGFQGYGEAIWWEVGASAQAHPIAEIGSLLADVTSTALGPVLVGSAGGLAIDLRPPESFAVLPGLDPLNVSSAWGTSADGSVHAGQSWSGVARAACRWIDRVPSALDRPWGADSEARSVSPDGASFAGAARDPATMLDRPVVWLAASGLVQQALVDHDGVAFRGSALGVLDSGLAFGSGQRGSTRFGWIWYPQLGTDRVVRMGTWLALSGLPSVPVQAVTEVLPVGRSLHFALEGPSLYAETPGP